MYNKVQCVCVTCDNCDKTFTDDYSGFSIFVDTNYVDGEIDGSDWHYEGGKHYCPECYTVDDEGNLIIKTKKDKQ